MRVSVLNRLRKRLAAQGIVGFSSYLLGTVVLERAGIAVTRVFVRDKDAPLPPLVSNLEFSVTSSVATFTERDVARLHDYGVEWPQAFQELFDHGEFCLIAREASGELCCVTWLTPEKEYPLLPRVKGVYGWGGFTLPDKRGRGYYTQSNSYFLHYARETFPDRPIFAECSVFNATSLKTIRAQDPEELGWFLEVGGWRHYRRVKRRPRQ